MVLGNLRAGLQIYEGTEINKMSQKSTYTMQHNPSSILAELKKLLSFANRKRMFAERGFNGKKLFCSGKSLERSLIGKTSFGLKFTICCGTLSHVCFSSKK